MLDACGGDLQDLGRHNTRQMPRWRALEHSWTPHAALSHGAALPPGRGIARPSRVAGQIRSASSQTCRRPVAEPPPCRLPVAEPPPSSRATTLLPRRRSCKRAAAQHHPAQMRRLHATLAQLPRRFRYEYGRDRKEAGKWNTTLFRTGLGPLLF